MTLLIYIFTTILIFTSIFLVFVILMQRAKNDGGMGSALGGGSMESTFGAETGNVLSGATIKASILFFVLSFALYLAHIYQSKHHEVTDTKLPTVNVPAAPTPLTLPVSTGPAPTAPGPNAAPATTTPAPQPATSQPVEPKKP